MIRALAVTTLIAAAAGFFALNFTGYRRAGKNYIESEREKRQTLGLQYTDRFNPPVVLKGIDKKKCR